MDNIYEYPEYYEIIFGRKNFKEETKFIIKLINKFSSIKAKNILDIACGTGQHIGELLKNNFKVTGLDISKRMLNKLDKQFKNNPNFIKSYQKDMASFNINEKFDACICMANSLEILIKNEQFISHFKSVANCLNKGGLYIIELDNPAFLFSLPCSGSKAKEYKMEFKKGKIKINTTYRRYTFDLINFVEKNELILDINDNGKKIKINDDSPIRRLTPIDIGLFIKFNSNFELIKILGDFNLNSTINDKESKKMIVILRKK